MQARNNPLPASAGRSLAGGRMMRRPIPPTNVGIPSRKDSINSLTSNPREQTPTRLSSMQTQSAGPTPVIIPPRRMQQNRLPPPRSASSISSQRTSSSRMVMQQPRSRTSVKSRSGSNDGSSRGGVEDRRPPDIYEEEEVQAQQTQQSYITPAAQQTQLSYITPAMTEIQISNTKPPSIRKQPQSAPQPPETPPNDDLSERESLQEKNQVQIDIVEMKPVMGMSRLSVGPIGMKFVKKAAADGDMDDDQEYAPSVQRNRGRESGSISANNMRPDQAPSQRSQRTRRPSQESSIYRSRLKIDTDMRDEPPLGSQRSPADQPPYKQYDPQTPESENSVNTNLYSAYSSYSNPQIRSVIEQRDRTASTLRGDLEEALTQLDIANREKKILEAKLSKREEGIGDSDVDSGFESINRERRESRAKDTLIAELRTQLEDAEAEAERYRERARELEKTSESEESLRDALFKTERSLKRERVKREDLQLECDELRNIITEIDAGKATDATADESAELRKINDELRNELGKTISQLDASTAENEDIMNQLEEVWELLRASDDTESRKGREDFSLDAFLLRTRRLAAAQEDSNRAILSLRSQLEEQQDRAAGRKRDGDAFDEERRDLEQKLRKEKARYREELALLEEDVDLANKKYREMKRELAFARNDAGAREAEVHQLTSQIALLKREAEFAKEAAERAYNGKSQGVQSDEQKENLERLEGQLKSLTERSQRLEADLSDREEECERLRAAVAVSTRKGEQSEEDKKNLERLEAQFKSLTDRYSALEAELSKRDEECAQLRAEIAASMRKEESKSVEKSSDNSAMAEAMKRLEEQHQKDSDTIEQLRDDLEIASKELASFAPMKESFGEREEAMLKKQNELEMELDAIMKEFDRIIERSADQEESSYRLKSELSKMTSKVEELEIQLSEKLAEGGSGDMALMEMVTGIQKESAKERKRLIEERTRLEGIISTMKREGEMNTWKRSTKGVQTISFGV